MERNEEYNPEYFIGEGEPRPIHELNDPVRLHDLAEELPVMMAQQTRMPGARDVYLGVRSTIGEGLAEELRSPDEKRRYEAFLYRQGLVMGFAMGFRLSQIVLGYEEEPTGEADDRVAAYNAWMKLDHDTRLMEMEDYLDGHGGKHIAANLLWPEGAIATTCLYKRQVGIRRIDAADAPAVYEVNTDDPNWEYWCGEGVLAGLWFMRAYRAERTEELYAEALPARIDAAISSLLDSGTE